MAITESKFVHVSISETSHHGNIAQYFLHDFWSFNVELPFHLLLFRPDGELAKWGKSTWHLFVCGTILGRFYPFGSIVYCNNFVGLCKIINNSYNLNKQ